MLDELEERLRGLGDVIQKDSVRGTFNAAALQGLQTDGKSEERTAKATEQTAQNTRRILDHVRNSSGLTFA